jgi:hypothetical protein
MHRGHCLIHDSERSPSVMPGHSVVAKAMRRLATAGNVNKIDKWRAESVGREFSGQKREAAPCQLIAG